MTDLSDTDEILDDEMRPIPDGSIVLINEEYVGQLYKIGPGEFTLGLDPPKDIVTMRVLRYPN